MQIIPVIDLLGGVVVRGLAGRRHEYRPIESRLSKSAAPAAIGAALRARFGFREAYVADLDAIAGADPAWQIFEALADCGLTLRIDAGIATADRARRIAEFHAGKLCSAVVVGLESLSSPRALEEMLATLGPDRLAFSLDLKAGTPLVAARDWQGLDAMAIADRALRLGVRRLIVLDLAQVGMSQGAGTESLCRRLRQRDAKIEIVAGGGVRGLEDLESMAAAGCNGALVASALHDERLTPQMLSAYSL